MMKRYIFLIFLATISFTLNILGEDVIIYTANQSFDSRIYILRMDGSLYQYYEYVNYHFVDMEVINNELYVSEAFAPRVYKVDLSNGNLEVIVDDWSLFYFYDLAYDGVYLYVTEWDLNRYDIYGNKDDTASFNEDVMGSAWDGENYWILNDTSEIKCWDLSGWPNLTELTDSAFSPPTPECRGLWFDGNYFWTAESKDYAGYIYQFDKQGQIINQWIEPTYRGWSACVIQDFISSVEEEEINQQSDNLVRINRIQSSGYINLKLTLPQPTSIDISVYFLSGEVAYTYWDKELNSGIHNLSLKFTNVPTGIYFCRVVTENKFETYKIMYFK
ncbi:MAG: T9SS type A sorting domain-containing protein [bacterium]